jgi:hypothetical protein
MKIEPTYVTFEQAIGLKEKGFDELCSKMYKAQCIWGFSFMGYRNSQIPIKSSDASAPEQWQVCEWLRLEHNIFVSVLHRDVRNQPTENNTYVDFKGFTFYVVSTLECKHLMSDEIDAFLNGGIGKGYGIVFNSPQEAYSAAFDYILKHLI